MSEEVVCQKEHTGYEIPRPIFTCVSTSAVQRFRDFLGMRSFVGPYHETHGKSGNIATVSRWYNRSNQMKRSRLAIKDKVAVMSYAKHAATRLFFLEADCTSGGTQPPTVHPWQHIKFTRSLHTPWGICARTWWLMKICIRWKSFTYIKGRGSCISR